MDGDMFRAVSDDPQTIDGGADPRRCYLRNRCGSFGVHRLSLEYGPDHAPLANWGRVRLGAKSYH